MSQFQKLLDGLFMCGEQEVKLITESKSITNVVDLRAEATEAIVQDPHVNWIHIPLRDGVPKQMDKLKEAITFVSTTYQQGKTTVLH